MSAAIRKPTATTMRTQAAMTLANLAAWWGFMVLPVYLVAFLLILPHQVGLRPEPAAVTTLPLVVPLIGLALALPALALARRGHRHDLGPAAPIAAVLNGIPAALALALRLLR
jgi:uncharacterized membrane protein YhaH (DUF805 family)